MSPNTLNGPDPGSQYRWTSCLARGKVDLGLPVQALSCKNPVVVFPYHKAFLSVLLYE